MYMYGTLVFKEEDEYILKSDFYVYFRLLLATLTLMSTVRYDRSFRI